MFALEYPVNETVNSKYAEYNSDFSPACLDPLGTLDMGIEYY